MKIGKNCLVGAYVRIPYCTFPSANDQTWNLDAEPFTIADDAWLGRRVMIIKGVTIGDGAVTAAGSLVTRDVSAHRVLGVPARVAKYLSGE